MRYLSVCSGIEAATLAWRPLGWTAAGFSEIEPFPSAVLAHYYPETPNLGDLNAFKDWPKIEADVLVGGTPCQSFSVAGLREGLADPRGNLTLVYLALADRIRPEWLVWENVPGVLSHDGGRTFGTILGALGKLGYGFAYRVLDARFFGVPQRRRRVFLVANSRAWQRAAAVLFEPESLRGDSAPGGPTRADVTGTLTRSALDGSSPDGQDGRTGFLVAGPVLGNGGRSGWRSGAEEAAGGHLVPEFANVLTARMHKGVNSDTNEGQTLIPDHADPISAHEGDTYTHEGRGNFRLHNVVACFDKTQITHRENRSTAAPDAAGLARTARPPAVALHRHMSRDGISRTPGPDADGLVRLRDAGFTVEHEVAPTLDQRPHSTLGPDDIAVRRLTPRECERLQGFPDDFTAIKFRGKPASDSQRYQAIGNSIARPVLEWIGRRIATVSEGAP